MTTDRQYLATRDPAAYGAGSFRQIARVIETEDRSVTVLTVHEVEPRAPDPAPNPTRSPDCDRFFIPLHELDPRAAGDIPVENEAFTNGDGAFCPRGFLSVPQISEGKWRWGSLGYLVTRVFGGFPATDPAAPIIALVYELPAHHRGNGVFVMNSKTAGAVRKLKDADGRFIFRDAVTAIEPPRLIGFPVFIMEAMPDIESGGAAIAFGDFEAGYLIADNRLGAVPRLGGDVIDYSAIKLLRFEARLADDEGEDE